MIGGFSVGEEVPGMGLGVSLGLGLWLGLGTTVGRPGVPVGLVPGAGVRKGLGVLMERSHTMTSQQKSLGSACMWHWGGTRG